MDSHPHHLTSHHPGPTKLPTDYRLQYLLVMLPLLSLSPPFGFASLARSLAYTSCCLFCSKSWWLYFCLFFLAFFLGLNYPLSDTLFTITAPCPLPCSAPCHTLFVWCGIRYGIHSHLTSPHLPLLPCHSLTHSRQCHCSFSCMSLVVFENSK